MSFRTIEVAAQWETRTVIDKKRIDAFVAILANEGNAGNFVKMTLRLEGSTASEKYHNVRYINL